jgi:hypothetical protein
LTSITTLRIVPYEVGLARADQLAGNFGEDFADVAVSAEIGKWFGPVKSAYGFHLVIIDQRVELEEPELPTVRDAVLRDWQSVKREEIAQARCRVMRERYQIEIDWPEDATGADTGNPYS